MDNDDRLDSFYDSLQDTLIEQASKLLNLDSYTNALLSTIPVALLATNLEGIIHSANHAAEDILGLSRKDLEGSSISTVFASNPEIIVEINKSIQSGKPFHMGSRTIVQSHNRKVVGNFFLQPFKDEENRIIGLLITIEDQTYVHFLQDAFKRYVPPSVSEMIAQNPQSLKLGGEEKVLTVLFCDIIGFTTYSERYNPHEMVTILSDYFSEMTDQVFSFEGTLKEYVGDELMAIFGAPIDQSNHAERACSAALKMQQRLKTLREVWQKRGRPPLKSRIGINTGPMLVGNIGSNHRFSYGVVGDNVNLASRLEGLNNMYGTRMLIGEATRESVRDKFWLKEIDQVIVKGKKNPVNVYELIDHIDHKLDDAHQESLFHYAQGLSAYRNCEWKAAAAHFKAAHNLWPEDHAAQVMEKRCKHYTQTPPPQNWDGVFTMQTK